MKDQIIEILQRNLQLDMPNPEEAEMNVASEISILIDAEVGRRIKELTPSNEKIIAAAKEWAKNHSEAPDKDCPDWIICDYEAGAYFVRQCYGVLNKTDKP